MTVPTLLALLVSLLAVAPVTPAGAVPADDSTVVINEIHYDNAGADVGEFVEIAATTGTDLAGYEVLLYNGNNGAVYGRAVVTDGAQTTADGFDFYVLEIEGIQNGAPDGVALVDGAGELVEFLSYEGTFEGVGGPAGGVTSTDIGVEQGSSTPIGQSLQRTAPDAATWFGPSTQTPGAPNEEVVVEPATCDPDADVTLISAVQGPGDVSPLATATPVFGPGETVTVEGVVTVTDTDLQGFFVQEEDDERDDDERTSEGVYVYAPAIAGDLAVGDLVQVTGAVTESFSRTQIGSEGNGPADAVSVCDEVAGPVTPVELPLPAGDELRERFEGMLITRDDLVVSGSFDAYQFGELVTGYQGELYTPTAVAEPGTASDQVLAENLERELRIDDRSTESFVNERWRFGDDDLRLGASLAVVGALDYTFGKWVVQPQTAPEITDQPLDAVPTLEGGNDVVSFNVLNYFNDFDGRGARNQEQFDLQSAKIVETITQLDAAVVGLVEIENDYEDEYDGDPSTVPSAQTLVDQLNAATAPGTYDWIRVPEALLTTEGLDGGGLGTDAIAVGFVYQPARAIPIGEAATFDIDRDLYGEPTDDDPAPASKNRWPLAQTFEIDGEVFTAVVNHFKSKGSSCLATGSTGTPTFAPGEDVDDDSTTASCDLVRQYAANELLEWIGTDPTDADDTDYLLLGDFNSYDEERPIQIFDEAGYTDLVLEQDDDAYTYKFSGRVGRLDYALSSPSLTPKVIDTEVWQINSRAQHADLYYVDSLETPETATVEGSSDHDPVVVALAADVDDAPIADAGGPYEVRVGNRTITLDATASFDPDGAVLTYAWDLDGDGSFDDAAGMTARFSSRGRPPGDHEVAVRVTDPGGLSSTATATVEVVTPGKGNSGRPPGRF